MTNLIKYIKSIFTSLKGKFDSSFLGSLYLSFLLWKENRRLEKENKTENLTMPMMHVPQVVKNDALIKYEQGLSNVKRKVLLISRSCSKEDLEKALENTEDLVKMARGQHEEDREEYVESLRKVYVYKDKDIKSDTDKAKMIEQRISDYDKLKKDKEKRELSRAIRAAAKDGKGKKAEKLMEKWKKNHGKSKNRL